MITVKMHNRSDLTVTDSIVWNPKLQLLEPQLAVSKIQNNQYLHFGPKGCGSAGEYSRFPLTSQLTL